MPAHDPRKEIGTGIGYPPNPQGADHTGVIIFHAEDTAEMVAASREKQLTTAAYDSAKVMPMPDPSLEVMAKLLSSFSGWNSTARGCRGNGQSRSQKRLGLNRNAGMGPASHGLPDFFKEEALPTTSALSKLPTNEFEKVLKLSFGMK